MASDKNSKEAEYRRQTCAYLQQAGINLDIKQPTIATAIIYFHRFYAKHSFESWDRNVCSPPRSFVKTNS